MDYALTKKIISELQHPLTRNVNACKSMHFITVDNALPWIKCVASYHVRASMYFKKNRSMH